MLAGATLTVDLPLANPVLLRLILENPRWASANLVVLRRPIPSFSRLAFMSAVRRQVHVDLSLALSFLGSGALGPLIELLSLVERWRRLAGHEAHVRIGRARPSRADRALRQVRRAVPTEPSTR